MELNPEVRAYLDARAGAPPRAALSVEQTREAYCGMAELAGPVIEVARVETTTIAGVPVRLYDPGSSTGVLEYLHGGRFFSGDLETHDRVCRALAAQSGTKVVAVDYRLAPESRFPAAAEDAYAVALALASEGARVVVGGDSAGGNLAAAVALIAAARGGPALAGQMLIYPMLDAAATLPSHQEFANGPGPGSLDMQRGWQLYLDGADPKTPFASPLYASSLAGLPPALVLTAEFDSLRNEGELYAHRLREAGIQVEFERYEGMIHGFFQMAGIFGAGRRAIEQAAAWVEQKCKLTLAP